MKNASELSFEEKYLLCLKAAGTPVYHREGGSAPPTERVVRLKRFLKGEADSPDEPAAKPAARAPTTASAVLVVLTPLPENKARRVIRAVCDEFHVTPEQIASDRRFRDIAQPRQVVMYLMRELFQYSYHAIGRRLGGNRRDHATVLHGIRATKRRMDDSAEFRERVEAVRARLGAPHHALKQAA